MEPLFYSSSKKELAWAFKSTFHPSLAIVMDHSNGAFKPCRIDHSRAALQRLIIKVIVCFPPKKKTLPSSYKKGHSNHLALGHRAEYLLVLCVSIHAAAEKLNLTGQLIAL